MATISLKGNETHTVGELPSPGDRAPGFALVGTGLSDKSLDDFAGARLLNVFPSLDTGVCAASVRKFNERAASRDGVTVLNISADLPFAHKRFCNAEGIEDAVNLSSFRSPFGTTYGVTIEDGPMRGLLARAVLLVDSGGVVRYTELVPEITQEPNYDAALSALEAL